MATYTFYPPQVMEGYPLADKWWRRVVSQRGVAVLINDGELSLARAVTEDELKDSKEEQRQQVNNILECIDKYMESEIKK